MSSRFDRQCPVPFAKVRGTTRGVIVKAALQTLNSDEGGFGTGSSNNLNTGFEFANGGLRKKGAGGNGFNFSMPLSSALQKTFHNVGAIQFGLHKEDVLSRSPSMGGPKILIDAYDGATSKALVVVDWVAQGSTAGNYREFTDTWSGAAVWTRAVAIRASSGWAVSENPQHVIHDGTWCDSDGFITYTVAWDALWMYWYQQVSDDKSVLISQFRRKNLAITPTMLRFFPDLWQVGGVECCPAIRNVLLLSSRPPHPNHVPGAYRVQLLAHSYGNKGNSLVAWDAGSGQYWAGDIGGFTSASADSVIAATRRSSRNALWLVNTSKSGQSTSWMVQQVTSNALADGRFFPPSNNSVTPRFRPHIVVLCGHMNEGADTAGVATGTASNMHSINAALVAQGIVPLWVIESNADITGTATFNHSVNVVPAMKAQIAADVTTYGDIGYANVYDATGGATVDGSYIEHISTPSSAVHHNYKGQALMGQMMAAEIDRLIATPPAYAWWK